MCVFMKLVCACDSVLLVPCLWGRGDEYVELFCQCICLCYIVCITGKSNVTAFTCAVKVSLLVSHSKYCMSAQIKDI